MAIPVTYIVRNLVARRMTTVLTAGGMALVVYVFATVLMLSAGLKATLVATGQDDNIIVIRRGAQSEVQSGIDRQARRASSRACPTSPSGRTVQRLMSKEPVVLINLPKRASGKPSNVVIRGITPAALTLRPNVKDHRGPDVPPRHRRRSSPGGRSPRAFAARAWARRCALPRAIGPSSACSTPSAPAFDSEIWGDAEQIAAGVPSPRFFRAVVQARRQ